MFFNCKKIVAIILLATAPCSFVAAETLQIEDESVSPGDTSTESSELEEPGNSTEPEFTQTAALPSPFDEISLDQPTFRKIRNNHPNLIIAITQPEERNNMNEIVNGDINSGEMRDVERRVLTPIAQHVSTQSNPNKLAFARVEAADVEWLWDFFNTGAESRALNRNNGTPQYLFFKRGQLLSVLVGNRDVSVFSNWVTTNMRQ